MIWLKYFRLCCYYYSIFRFFCLPSISPISIIACLNMSFLGGFSPNVISVVIMALLVVSAGVWPPLGLSLSVIALSVAMLFCGNYIISSVLIVVCCFHCVFGFSVSISGLTASEHSPNDALQLIQDIRNT